MSYKSVCLSIALIGIATVPSAAEELSGTLKKIKDLGAVTIGHRESSVPFSYYDGKEKVIGYAIDLCGKVVGAIKLRLNMPNLRVVLTPETPATRIPLLSNGTIDLECGSTSNSLDRQKQVAFSITDFVAGARFVSKAADKLRTLDDLRGKTVVTTSGTSTVKLINELKLKQNLQMTIILAKDHADAFLTMQVGRASAFFMDDVLLAGLVATSNKPDDFVISPDSYSVEPYGIMLRRDDPDFKKVVDDEIAALYSSGEINAIYAKWFTAPIPSSNVNMKLPMSAAFKKVVAHPIDSGDPSRY